MLYSSGPAYSLNRSSGTLPVLVPGLEYVEELMVTCTDPARTPPGHREQPSLPAAHARIYLLCCGQWVLRSSDAWFLALVML